jgi:hypothetical protein
LLRERPSARRSKFLRLHPEWFNVAQKHPIEDFPMNDDKKPWYQLKDSETKWYHHLMHGRVLIMLVLMAIVALLAIGVGILTFFAP